MNTTIAQLKLKVLSNVSEVVGHALDLRQSLAHILEILSRELSMKRATITLKREESPELAIAASHGMTTQEQSRGVYRLDEGVTGLIFTTGKPFVVPDVSKEPLFLNKTGARAIEKDGLSFLGVPIILHNKTVGVLSVDRLFDTDVSFEEDLQFLTVLAGLIAQLISLNDQVRARERVLLQANKSLKKDLSGKFQSFFGLAQSPVMEKIQKVVRKVAETDATVLLLGESGTGKTLVAQIIHELSPRSRYAFVQCNSAALPESLLESELFGYEKGAFTGANENRMGRVEEADKGTLFLDEIGELSQSIQVKFLRFLQDRQFERLGSTKTRSVDVRIVAATNRDLEQGVREATFREDLYYRLNVFPIYLPPLRARKEDMEMLVGFFARKFSRKYGCNLEFTRNAIDALKNHPWPGNVRELENLLERLAIMWEGGPIGFSQIVPYISHAPRPQGPTDRDLAASPSQGTEDTLQDTEKRRLIRALETNSWVQTRAAQELGITLRQIGYKIRKHRLEDMVKTRRRGQGFQEIVPPPSVGAE
ncbi:MAG: sigma 54-interacting transcriptional regulator [Deltaproteobacteria bacterium]